MTKVKRYVCISLSVVLLFCFACTFVFADDDDIQRDETPNIERIDSTVEIEQLRISPSDTSGLHAIILSLIGDYNSIVKDYTYQTTSYNGTTTTNHVVEITPDYSWIASCLVFIVVLYCVFRFLGAIVKGW